MADEFTAWGREIKRNGEHYAYTTRPEDAEDIARTMQAATMRRAARSKRRQADGNS